MPRREIGRCRSRVRRVFTVESGDGELYFVVVVVKKKMGRRQILVSFLFQSHVALSTESRDRVRQLMMTPFVNPALLPV